MLNLFIGAYTEKLGHVDGKGEGIYTCTFLDGKISIISTLRTDNPSYLCVSSDKEHLYAVSESTNGHISSYKINADKSLLHISTVKCNGDHPCHIDSIFLSDTLELVGVANYSSGNFSIYEINKTKSPGILLAANITWPTGPPTDPYNDRDGHAHYFHFLKNKNKLEQKFAVIDLGFDGIYTYKLKLPSSEDDDESIVTLAVCNDKSIPFKCGAGPRHFAFSPIFNVVYVICELNSTIIPVQLDKDENAFIVSEFMHEYDALPPSYSKSDRSGAADICTSQCGNFVFCSLRGSVNEIVTFKVSGEYGEKLTIVERINCGGKTPRNICLDPSGNYLLVANQDSSNIVSFSLNHDSGFLTFVCDNNIPTPVCIKFY